MNNQLSEHKDNIKSLGLVLVFVGMQLNTAVRNVLPGFDGVAIIMLLSFLCLIQPAGFKGMRISKEMFGLLVFQVILLMMAIISDKGTTQLISFHLFLIATIVALITNRKHVNFQNFGQYMFYVSGFISLVVLYQATSGFSQLTTSFYGTGKLWLAQGGDPITLPRAIEMNLIACLFYEKRNAFEKVLTGIFVASDVMGLFSFSNRSTILVSLLLFILWIVLYAKRINVKRILIITVGGLTLIYLLYKIPYFTEKLTMLTTSINRGIRTFLGFNTDVLDSSAQSRISNLSKLQEDISRLGIARVLLIGMGYNYMYLDRPIIQAYTDLGIIGGVAYVFYLVIVPIKAIYRTVRKKIVPNEAWILCILFSVQTLADHILTGIPYYFFLWTPTIFILFSQKNNNSGKSNDKSSIGAGDLKR